MNRRYAICGVSNRCLKMFVKAMVNEFSSQTTIVGLLDSDPRRFDICKSNYPGLADVPEYGPNDFERMIEQTKPDVIIVTGRDDTHVTYIVRALEHDLDVISEKPMATTGSDCRKILEAESRSKGKVTVAFNYRYNPIHSRIKELVLEGKVGRVTSVDLNWYVDTYHGSSYFKRWNRKRQYSGGLSIHKSSHHFDLVNWWIDQKPLEVSAYGALHYFGPEGEDNPSRVDGRYCASCGEKQSCNYFMRWSSRSKEFKIEDDHIETMLSREANQAYSHYRADACIFDSEIDIEDTYAVIVKYDKGALLNYSINFSLPYEGYRLAINGTKGRIETQEYHASGRTPFPVPVQTIDYIPLFGSKETIHVVHREGGHGGGDPVLLEDIFLGPDPRRSYAILSGAADGANSVGTGEAVWRSVKENRPIQLTEILS